MAQERIALDVVPEGGPPGGPERRPAGLEGNRDAVRLSRSKSKIEWNEKAARADAFTSDDDRNKLKSAVDDPRNQAREARRGPSSPSTARSSRARGRLGLSARSS